MAHDRRHCGARASDEATACTSKTSGLKSHSEVATTWSVYANQALQLQLLRPTLSLYRLGHVYAGSSVVAK